MKRIALLGATGSIGRQALEIIEAHPELELCAAASGSQPIDGLAPLTQAGGDLTELLERAEPDLVLNAVVGFAGLPATLWALERGVDLALANKESLVAAGELALATQRRGGGRLIPVDSEHSGAFQCLEGRSVDQVHSLVLTASGGPFRGRGRDELEDVTPAAALAHPTWNMGPKITVDSATLANKGLELIEAHFLFGLPYEQIEVVVHPTSVVHALVRFRDGATLAHLGYPDMRVPISYALTYPERSATPIPPLDLAGGMTLEFEPPDLETFPLLAHARKAGERGGTYPCVFNAANEVAVAAFLEDACLPRNRRRVAEALAGVDGSAGARSRRARRGRRGGPASRREGTDGRMSILISILGLAVLILLHEAGHFFVARAVGMRPRRFYLGFPPALVKVTRNGIEYGIGAIPLGGYVKIPGMHRPAASDLDVQLAPALAEDPSLFPKVARVKRALEAGDLDGAREMRARARTRRRGGEPQSRCGEGGAALGGRAARRAQPRRLLAPADVEAHRGHLRRPRREHRPRGRARGVGIHLRRTRRCRPTVRNVKPDTPAASVGLRPGDTIVAVNGRETPSFDAVSRLIRASNGKPTTITVRRDGKALTLGPVRTKRIGDRWALGFEPGWRKISYGPTEALTRSLSTTWAATKATVTFLPRLVTGAGRKEVSSPVGIVDVSSQAVSLTFTLFLQILGLISLSLAILNLLPLLPLDGGHILFSIIEGRSAAVRLVVRSTSACPQLGSRSSSS